jgi:AcrR family transcriptional regulator
MATQAERREATRRAIIVAATDLFGRNGFSATTVDEIASAAAVAKGAVYHHFTTKESIFEAVFEETSLDLVMVVTQAARQEADVLDAMAAGTRAYFEACSKGVAAQIILRDGPSVLGWQRWRDIDAKHFGRMIPDALAVAMNAGLIEPQPMEPLARLLLGAVTEAAVACASSDSPATSGGHYAVAFQHLLAGLRRRQETRPMP